jgi:hypothetical protein
MADAVQKYFTHVPIPDLDDDKLKHLQHAAQRGELLFFVGAGASMLVVGFEREFGYFSLSELQTARGVMGHPIERDLY